MSNKPLNIPSPKKQNNYAFIDSQNLNLGVRSQGWKLDWKKFRQYLRDKYSIQKAYVFIGQVAGNEGLYTYLQESGYILIFKPVLEHTKKGKSIIKGNVDAELVMHTMIQYRNYSRAIIVSGDGDFHCLIEHLANSKKLLKVIVPTNKYSSLLRKFNTGRYITCIELAKNTLEDKKKTGIRGRSKP